MIAFNKKKGSQRKASLKFHFNRIMNAVEIYYKGQIIMPISFHALKNWTKADKILLKQVIREQMRKIDYEGAL